MSNAAAQAVQTAAQFDPRYLPLDPAFFTQFLIVAVFGALCIIGGGFVALKIMKARKLANG